ncbi:putative peptide modification system cyclase [Stenotrophomonas geniculata]
MQAMNGDNGTSAPHSPQLRALLFTDLCDSLQLVERIGDVAAASLFQEHDRLVLVLQHRWNGQLIDRSDGLFMLFERAIDALGFALDYQCELHTLGQQRSIELRARAGLHVGDVLTWDNSPEAVRAGAKSMEVEGLAKPMAARLMMLARPGQILLSAVAESLTRRATDALGERGARLLWKSHGRWRFKGVPVVQEVIEVGEIGSAPLRMPRANAKARRDLPLWRQPLVLAAEGLVLTVAVLGGWLLLRPEPAIAFAERDWVVLGDVDNLTGDPIFDDSMRHAIRIALEQSRYVNVLSEGKIRESLEMARLSGDTRLNRDTAVDVAVREGARAVLLPTVRQKIGGYELAIDVAAPGSGQVIQTFTATVDRSDQMVFAVDDVVGRLRRGLGESVASLEQSLPLPRASTQDLRALRAFALAESALGQRRFEEARNLYQAAIDIDPGFALAYMGVAKLLARTAQVADARDALEHALAQQQRLPARERLYLKGWQAELEPGGWPLEQWRALAKIYPDSFAGLSNTSWGLLQDNRFAEAAPYARAATVPQDPLRLYPMIHLARAQLGLGQPQQAMRTLHQAQMLRGNDEADDLDVDVLVAQGLDAQAQQLLMRLPRGDDLQQRMRLRANLLVAAEQRDCSSLHAAIAADGPAPDLIDYQIHQRLQHATVTTLCTAGDAKELESIAAMLRPLLRKNDDSAVGSRSLQLLALTYLAQRQGQHALAAEWLRDHGELLERQRSPVVGKWRRVVLAMAELAQQRPQAARHLLEPTFDGSEPVQAHVVLLQALRAEQDTAGVRREQAWLARHHGQAIAEVASMQVWQPLNVHDIATEATSVRVPR